MEKKMNLLILISKPEDKNLQRFLMKICSEITDSEITFFTDFNRMFKWLSIPPRDFFAAVLFPGSDEVLKKIVSL